MALELALFPVLASPMSTEPAMPPLPHMYTAAFGLLGMTCLLALGCLLLCVKWYGPGMTGQVERVTRGGARAVRSVLLGTKTVTDTAVNKVGYRVYARLGERAAPDTQRVPSECGGFPSLHEVDEFEQRYGGRLRGGG